MIRLGDIATGRDNFVRLICHLAALAVIVFHWCALRLGWRPLGIRPLFFSATPVIAAAAALPWYGFERPALALKRRAAFSIGEVKPSRQPAARGWYSLMGADEPSLQKGVNDQDGPRG
jgi:hypothetical protein